MNFLELCKDLVSEAGYSGTIGSTQDQVGQFARVVKWVRDAEIDIQNEHEDWLFLDREFSFMVEEGKDRYSLEELEALGIERVGTWDRDRMLITDAYGQSRKLFWSDFRLFHHRFGTSLLQEGKPQFFAVMPDGGLILGPEPDGEYQISGWYRLKATPMVQDEDEPTVPEPFHQAIVWKALTYYGMFEEAQLHLSRGEQLYREALNKMRLRYLPDVRMPGPLA